MCVCWLCIWVRDKLYCRPLVGWSRVHLSSVKLLEQPHGDVQFICLLSSHWISPALICSLCILLLHVFVCFFSSLLAMPSFLRGFPIHPYILINIQYFKLVFGHYHFFIEWFSRSYMFLSINGNSFFKNNLSSVLSLLL